MSDNKRNSSNGTVDQLIGNITSDIQNADGQFIRLGFTPPATPVDGLSWNQPLQNQFAQYNLPSGLNYNLEQQYGQPPCDFIPQPGLFNTNLYDKHDNFDMYPNLQQNGLDVEGNLFTPNYKLFSPQNQNIVDQNYPQRNRTHLIDNLVGNWVMPNTNGMYSPFGNAQYVPNINAEVQAAPDPGWKTFDDIELIRPRDFVERQNEDTQFQFSRDNRKPRMVAEVKPMRPSYSDVLLKSAPISNIKVGKSDNKESKQRKENKKNTRNEKVGKVNSVLNRSNTSNDIKDVNEKNTPTIRSNEKTTKNNKSSNLNRKWASMDNVTEIINDIKEENQKNKTEDLNTARQTSKHQKRGAKAAADLTDTDSSNSKNDAVSSSKNVAKKGVKGLKQRNHDSFGSNDRPPGKRGQRFKKKESNFFGVVGQKLKHYLRGWWKLFVYIVFWLVRLVSDICSLSVHLSRDMVYNFWKWLTIHGTIALDTVTAISQRVRIFTWIWSKIRPAKEPEETNRNFLHKGLQHNINMPTTGEDAMKRLLACKGKDPYSILGVTTTCTDDDIKRYYKKQAFLVHPDKNQQPGAEEAFKILVHAFDMIGEPERRASYDRGVAESAQVEQAWSELNDLLEQLQQKVEAAANTIRCSACNLRHKRIKVDRPTYAARNCTMCKIHHSAREGDIWAEAKCYGFLWHYFACMEGGVYDITEWAGCQKESLKHLRPDSHHVQYRIALGKQSNQSRRHSSSPRNEKTPDLENLLNSLYGQAEGGPQNTKRRNKKNK